MFRDLELGVIRLHILYHATIAPFYGAWMLAELARHGYQLSYGTLYPTLHKLEEEGLLIREERLEHGRIRKYYTATTAGHAALAQARRMIAELHRELMEQTESAPASGEGDE
jgi:DNA-binding PadR family transcriptional regulator